MILPLEPKLTVIAGINGIGKTTIVDALALLFSWLTARTKRDSGNGRSIDERDIKHGAKYAELSIATSAGKWSLAKSRKGVIESKKSDLTNLRDIVYSLRKKLDQETALPVFACYPVERAVVRIPLRIRTKHNFDPVSIYDESLIGRTDFSLFFEWFREREDIENENFRTKDQNGYPDSQLFQF